MSGPTQATDDDREVVRLRDEVEQLRTALEAASDEVDRMVEERSRLLLRVTGQARELQAANSAYSKASARYDLRAQSSVAAQLKSDQDQEELRVAFEEMQVLTEELETANNSLRETNQALDQRVEERTRELAVKNTALAESELRFRTLVEGMPQLVWRAIEGGNWTWASPQWTKYTGLSAARSLGQGWLDALHPDDREAASDAWARAMKAGGFEVEYRLCHAAEQAFRWFQTRATPVRDENGEILEWLGTSTDVHDLRELQERQEVLVAELQHRTRNLMGVVRSMADKTARASIDLPDFRSRFRDRLEALSRVQGLLSRLNEHDRVTFDELIRTELSAMQGNAERVVLDGPSGVRLRSSTLQILALVLHELATNAVKYGALGQPTATLAIYWSVEPGDGGKPWLHIEWRESGVQMPVSGSTPAGSGQGRELIERALPYQLKAKTSYTLGPDGVHCTIHIPVSDSALGSEKDA